MTATTETMRVIADYSAVPHFGLLLLALMGTFLLLRYDIPLYSSGSCTPSIYHFAHAYPLTFQKRSYLATVVYASRHRSRSPKSVPIM